MREWNIRQFYWEEEEEEEEETDTQSHFWSAIKWQIFSLSMHASLTC